MAKERKSIILLSNGHGEDLLGATLAENLRKHIPHLELAAFPLMGKGGAYTALGIPLVMPGRELPSGGFSRNSLHNLLLDLRDGLIGFTRRQARVLRSVKDRFDLAVCLGDVFLLTLAGMMLKLPVFFLPTAKSDYIASHWPLEIWLMRRFCTKIFPRDAVTGSALARRGLPVEFAGNLMMDALRFTSCQDFRSREEEWIVAMLPGSRREAYMNMEDLAGVAVAFHDLLAEKGETRPVTFLVALSGGLAFSGVVTGLLPLGWAARPASGGAAEKGVAGYLEYRGGARAGIRLAVVQGRFADVLAACDAVLGLAGTANEQAAGLGKPVLAFPGRGPQFTKKFARMQKKLLGEALALTERNPRAVAEELYAVLTEEKRRKKMARAGRERMGGPGGAQRVALIIKNYLAL